MHLTPIDCSPAAAAPAVDPSARPIRDVERELTELAGRLNAANYRFLVLLAEYDRRTGWSDSVTRSCAHWLNWQCGIELGAARKKVRVATPETESYLLMIALHGTAQHVEKLVRGCRPRRASC